MIALRFISLLFPFIKESILGKATIRESLKTNRRGVLTLGICMLSIALNLYLVPKSVTITLDYLEMKKLYEKVGYVYNENKVLEDRDKRQANEIKTLQANLEKAVYDLACARGKCPADSEKPAAPVVTPDVAQIQNDEQAKKTYDRLQEYQDRFKKWEESGAKGQVTK